MELGSVIFTASIPRPVLSMMGLSLITLVSTMIWLASKPRTGYCSMQPVFGRAKPCRNRAGVFARTLDESCYRR